MCDYNEIRKYLDNKKRNTVANHPSFVLERNERIIKETAKKFGIDEDIVREIFYE